MTRKIIIVDKIKLKPAPGSKVIMEIGYRKNTETLRVKFSNGRIFDYVGVDLAYWNTIESDPHLIDQIVLRISTEFQSVQVYEK